LAKKKKNDQVQGDDAIIDQGQDRMSRYGVKTESKKVKKREAFIRILVIILVILLLFLSVMFACSSYINKAGDFTVTMNKDAFNMGLSLSETPDFAKPTRFLAGTKVENMGDTTLGWLPDNLDDVNGSHNSTNGQDFLAYTFYVKNAGEIDVGYDTYISIDSVALNADEAMRVMVYVNGEPTIYAKPKKGTIDTLEDNEGHYSVDKNFTSSTRVMEASNDNFKVGDIDKYTVVIWLEGWDPECVNDILNGEVKLSMSFNSYSLEDSGGTNA
jgi:hypothetical protein